MAHQEACQLYIEQEIEEGLKQGKTPYSIGKELSAWVEKLFEAKVPAETIRSKARYHQKKAGETTTPDVTLEDNMQIPKKQKYQPDKQPGPDKQAGPGRKPKFQKPSTKPKTSKPGAPQYAAMISDAIHFANVAISQLERIEMGDPERRIALFGS
jgi:hypothetical protein